MRHSENIELLANALCSAQAEMGAVTKDGTNPHFHSSFASLANVVQTAMPILTKYGLSISQDPDYDGVHDLLTTTLMHVSGQWKTSSMLLHLPKQDPQGQGSALTYAKRYAFMACLCLVAEEDDDGNAASKPKSRPRSGPPVPSRPAAAAAPSTPARGPLTPEEIQRMKQEAMAK